jgi:hypothetical protein
MGYDLYDTFFLAMRAKQCEAFHARYASFFLLGSALLMRSLSAPKQVQVKIGLLGGRVKK